MSLRVGTQLGSLEITGLLGRGGMGEVYRARDLKLKREVAIKILPEEFSRDPDRVSRFQREAEVLASLNHPNIAVITICNAFVVRCRPCCPASFPADVRSVSGIRDRCACVLRHLSNCWRTSSRSGGIGSAFLVSINLSTLAFDVD